MKEIEQTPDRECDRDRSGIALLECNVEGGSEAPFLLSESLCVRELETECPRL